MAPNETTSDYIEDSTSDTADMDDSIQSTPTESLEPEEVGIQIYVFLPKHSKSARKLATKQLASGITTEKGTIKLPDGQSIKFGATCKTEMRPELKIMLRDGVFLAGKAPRRE